jgi:hypothetical protein
LGDDEKKSLYLLSTDAAAFYKAVSTLGWLNPQISDLWILTADCSSKRHGRDRATKPGLSDRSGKATSG